MKFKILIVSLFASLIVVFVGFSLFGAHSKMFLGRSRYLKIPNNIGALSSFSEKVASLYPYDYSSKTGVVVNPNDDENFIVSGRIESIRDSELEVSTKYGLFLLKVDQNTKYFFWSKNKGISSTEQKLLSDFSVGDSVYARCTVKGRDIVVLDMQKVLTN